VRASSRRRIEASDGESEAATDGAWRGEGMSGVVFMVGRRGDETMGLSSSPPAQEAEGEGGRAAVGRGGGASAGVAGENAKSRLMRSWRLLASMM
jgi:hypothetical protein